MPSIVGFYSADIKFFIKPKKIKVSKKWKKIPENGKANFGLTASLHFLPYKDSISVAKNHDMQLSVIFCSPFLTLLIEMLLY
ncbi:MAG: hypothetical protein KG029_00025 [Bacteroidetes bacterium]|nr:hypothetical protein [Bacteroidota bacterium]